MPLNKLSATSKLAEYFEGLTEEETPQEDATQEETPQEDATQEETPQEDATQEEAPPTMPAPVEKKTRSRRGRRKPNEIGSSDQKDASNKDEAVDKTEPAKPVAKPKAKSDEDNNGTEELPIPAKPLPSANSLSLKSKILQAASLLIEISEDL